VFQGHLQDLLQAEARNPEVQNRYDDALARGPYPGPNVSFSGNEANPLFHNTGAGFADLGATLGAARTEDSRGFVLTDLDGDGAQDVVLHNYHRNPLVALLNRAGGGRSWIRIRLRGKASNRFGIGARVTVEGRIRELSCGSGYLSASAPELHFGLGDLEKADVELRWPSGAVERYPSLSARRVHTLHEGDAAARTEATPKRVEIPIPAVPAPAPAPDPRSALAALKVPTDRPVLAILIRPACHACGEEMANHAEIAARAKAAGLDLLWIATEGDPAAAERQLRAGDPAARVLAPAAPLSVKSTPEVWWVTPTRAERFTGRFAVKAALEEAARR
jgi:hypothetical protein